MDDRQESLIKTTGNYRNAAAAIPALLLCGATFFVLVLDIVFPAMRDAQYLVYPIAIRIVGLISILSTAVCLFADIENKTFHFDVSGICFAMFILCIILSTFANGWSSQAVFGVKYRYIGVFDLCIYAAVYMYSSGRIRPEKWRDAILTVFILMADAIALAFICSEIFVSIPAFENKKDFAGMFYHGNHYGYFLTMAVVISAGFFVLGKGKKATASAASLVLNLIVLIINRTRGAMLAAGIAVVIMIIMTLLDKKRDAKKAKWLAAGFILAVLLSLIVSSGFRAELSEMMSELILVLSGTNDIYAGNGRWGIWQFVIELIAEKPLLGHGNEGITDVLYDYAFTSSPHNEPLTYAAFFGIPAAFFYTAGVLARIIKALADKNSDISRTIAAFAAMAYFASSAFGVAMFCTTPFMFVVLGMSRGESRQEENLL